MSRTVTVHSDGTALGTVVLTEDGERFGNVTHLDLAVDATDGASLTLEVRGSGIKANVQAQLTETTFHCQACGEYCEHRCDAAFGGNGEKSVWTPSNGVGPVTATQGQTVLPFNICGEILGDAMCYVRKGVDHTAHIDIRQGVQFT